MTSAEFLSIFEANKDAVYGFAWRMTGSPETAEDVAQDCFLQLLKSPGQYDGARGPIRAWLLGVSRNLILKRWRSEGRWIPLDDETVAADALAGDCQLDGTVAHAVQSLPALQREVVILIEYQGLTLEETAHAVAAEVGTVKARPTAPATTSGACWSLSGVQTMTDDELRSKLGAWQAPPAPETLRARVFPRRRSPFQWLLSGEIRVPVPIALAALCLLIFIGYRAMRPAAGSLSDFKQVEQLQPRIVRTSYENR